MVWKNFSNKGFSDGIRGSNSEAFFRSCTQRQGFEKISEGVISAYNQPLEDNDKIQSKFVF